MVYWWFLFKSVLQRDKGFKQQILQPGDFIYRKRYLQKDSLQPHCEALYC